MMTTLLASVFAANAPKIITPKIDYTAIMPELILLGGMLVMIAISAMFNRQKSTMFYAVGTAGIGIASLVASLVLWHDVTDHGAFTAVANAVDVDGFSVFVLITVSTLVIIGALIAPGYLKREGVVGCEYYALALISASGAMLMGASNDLILIFLALEILSIPLYVMAGFDQRREASGEAAMKYFVLGAFSSAIFLYGIALVYGATGSTNLAEISGFLARNVVTSNGVLLGGLGLMLVGFGFKIAAVPFHMWTPDVYQGSPTLATGFMAAVAKVGGFAALLRVFVSGFPTIRSDWQPIIWALCALTVVIGAVLALVQTDIKRMMAYSSINHAGFILLGVQAATAKGVSASLYYLFIYGFIVLASFAIIDLVGGKGDDEHPIAGYKGLAQRSPALAVAFAILLLAQAGAPFTTGFLGKFYVVEAAVDQHSYALAVIAMSSAAIAAFFYLRIVFLMFGSNGEEDEVVEANVISTGGGVATLTAIGTAARIEVPTATAVAIFLGVAVTVVFGFWPQPVIEFAHQAVLLF